MNPRGIVLRYAAHKDAGLQDQPPDNVAPASAALATKDRKTKISSQDNISSDEYKNLMPSMVVRQQRNQNTSNNNHDREMQTKTKASSSFSTTEQVFEEAKRQAALAASGQTQQQQQQQQQQHSFDQDGLILPRRVLPHHLTGANEPATTVRDLNRELKFNQSRGKNVLDQKSELKRAMEKLEANKRRKEAEQERLTRRTSLELRLEERAQRLAPKEGTNEAAKQPSNILSN